MAKMTTVNEKMDKEKRGTTNSGQIFTDIIPAYLPNKIKKQRSWKYLKGLGKTDVSYSLHICNFIHQNAQI